MSNDIFDMFRSSITLDVTHDKRLSDDKAFIEKTQTYYQDMYGQKLEPSLYNPIVIHWSEKGRGFGQYVFYCEGDKIYCYNECDSKETVKKILCKMVDESIFLEE